MAFSNPKQRIAVMLAERKKSLGPVPSSPTAPMNAIKNPPSLVAPSPLGPTANPMTPAVTALGKMPKFGKIKSKFGSF